ncbi:MAG: DUF2062 domain-containing protein [Lewinellaceae bacterium]|nr:DUF2062 domain-containing protein [Lewinellaceae bacterium]
MKNSWLQNTKAHLLGFLKQGTSPKSLALSTTLGLLLGIFPMLGVTTFAMTLIAVKFRLNLPLMLFVSYLIYPLQIFLIIPFVRMGEWLFGAPPIALTLDVLEETFRAGFFYALQKLGTANLMAVAGWGVLAPMAGVLLYFLLLFTFQARMRKVESTLPPGEGDL